MHHHDPHYAVCVHEDRVRRLTRAVASPRATDLERELAAAAAGDGRAWAAIVDRFRGHVARIARSYGLGAHQVDDVAQETWLRLWRNVGAVRDPRGLRSWLGTTAHRESLRALARSRREEPTDREIGADMACGEDLDELVVGAERSAALRRAVDTLPLHQRALIELLLDEPELTHAQVAKRLGIPTGSVGPTRGRSMDRLRRELAPSPALSLG